VWRSDKPHSASDGEPDTSKTLLGLREACDELGWCCLPPNGGLRSLTDPCPRQKVYASGHAPHKVIVFKGKSALFTQSELGAVATGFRDKRRINP